MAYTKQNFKDGAILFASQLEAMEDGIINSAPVKGTDYWTARMPPPLFMFDYKN